VTRFDFLRDGLPDAVEGALAFRLPRRLRTAAYALVTVVCAIVACAGFEAMRTNAATAIERTEEVRLDSARDRLAAANLELQNVASLLETDRRLRAVRTSGTQAVLRLARIGNLVPRGVWLSSVEPSADGLSVEGEAVNVDALHRVLSNFVTDTSLGKTLLLRMARLARPSGPALVSFTLLVKEGSR
jgi:Tfp pilus assembly protein PilN